MKSLKILLFLLLTSTMAQVSAQINAAPSVLQVGDVSSKLKAAIGWKKNSANNWVSNQNAIADTQIDEQGRSTVPQDFKWIQFLKVKLNDQNYYTLVYENELKDSSIGNVEKRINFYLLPESKYQNLINFLNSPITNQELILQSPLYGYMSDKDGVYNQERLLNLFQESINRPKSVQSDFNLQMINKTDGSTSVKFRLPHPSSILDSGLEEEYFEVPKADLTSILLPITVQPQVNQVQEESTFEIAPTTTSTLQTSSNYTNNAPIASTVSSYQDNMPDRNDAASTTGTATTNNTNSATTQDDIYTSSFLADYYTDNNSTIDTDNQSLTNDSTDPFDVPDRVSKESAVVSQPIAILGNVVGWYYNKDGQWVKEGAPSYNFETVGRYEIRNVEYRGRRYLAFTKYQKYSGAIYYLLPASSFVEGVKNMDRSSMFKVPVIVSCGAGYTLEEMIEKGTTIIDTPPNPNLVVIQKEYLVFQYRVSKAKDIARFFIFEEECTQYGETGSQTCYPELAPNTVKYDETHIVGTNELFNKMYYETTAKQFMTFMVTPLQNTKATSK